MIHVQIDYKDGQVGNYECRERPLFLDTSPPVLHLKLQNGSIMPERYKEDGTLGTAVEVSSHQEGVSDMLVPLDAVKVVTY